jgi:ribose-phosphate pyrophosphokinase
MISSGGTIRRAAEACRARGAAKVFAMAAHGLFGKGAAQLFADAALDEVIVTDSLANAVHFKSANPTMPLRVVSVAALFAEAIKRLHFGGSISELTGFEN